MLFDRKGIGKQGNGETNVSSNSGVILNFSTQRLLDVSPLIRNSISFLHYYTMLVSVSESSEDADDVFHLSAFQFSNTNIYKSRLLCAIFKDDLILYF